MTAIGAVRAARRELALAAAVAALLWAIAAAVSLMALIKLLGARGRLDVDVCAVAIPAAITFAIMAFCAALWRARHARSRARVALWLEERLPALQYAAVTATDAIPGADQRYLDGVPALVDVPRVVHRASAAAILRALAALLIAMSVFMLAASHAGERRGPAERTSARGGRGLSAATPSRLSALRVRVRPPPYTRRAAIGLDDPSSVSALIGSVIEVRGAGSPAGLDIAAAGKRLRAAGEQGAWVVSFTMPGTATVLTMADRSYQRAIVLAPERDALPSMLLREPARDTVFRTVPSSPIALSASASDDIGLATGRFEVLISSGSGEIYKARAVTLGGASFGGVTRSALSGTLLPAALGLAPGDVISVRAVARDRNPDPLRPSATSDTRTLRIARADEYDSVAVEGAPPPPVDSVTINRVAITNRMYIRGRAPEVVVDVASVRLKGGEKGNSNSRAAHAPADSLRATQTDDLLRAIVLVRTSPPDALVQLAKLSASALGSNPALAAALGDAMQRLRAGRDAAPALARARIALSGAPDRGSAPQWGRW